MIVFRALFFCIATFKFENRKEIYFGPKSILLRTNRKEGFWECSFTILPAMDAPATSSRDAPATRMRRQSFSFIFFQRDE